MKLSETFGDFGVCWIFGIFSLKLCACTSRYLLMNLQRPSVVFLTPSPGKSCFADIEDHSLVACSFLLSDFSPDLRVLLSTGLN